MAEKAQKRQIAYKIRIKDLLAGKYTKEEGWSPNYIETEDGRNISRINLIGVVVSKQPEEVNYQSIVLDDGTGRITVRTFDEKNRFDIVNIGDIILVIGRPREYGGERYVLLEILRKIENEKWMQLRKLELGKEPIKKQNEEKPKDIDNDIVEEVVEEEVIEDKYQKTMEKIKDLDKGEGADFEEVVKDIEDGEKLIESLLQRGEVFEVSPGKLKVLE